MSPNPSHKWLLNIQTNAQDRFNRLTTAEKRVIFRHLRELLLADDPNNLPFVEMLQAKKFNRVRKFRAGNYRVFFAVEMVEITHLSHSYKGTFFLLDIRDRKEKHIEDYSLDMSRFYIRLILIPTALFTLVLLLIHAQPYDDHELRELLLPEGCPAPCFIGIRPGITTAEEAIKLLESNKWVDSIDNQITDKISIGSVSWNWNNRKPKAIIRDSKFIYQDVQGQLWVKNNVVIEIMFHTNYLLGDTRIVFGLPSAEGSASGDVDLTTNKLPVFYIARYIPIGLSVMTWGYCEINKPRMLQKEVTFSLSVPASLQSTTQSTLNTISYACRN